MYPSFIWTSTKNGSNAHNAIWSRVFGPSITRLSLETALEQKRLLTFDCCRPHSVSSLVITSCVNSFVTFTLGTRGFFSGETGNFVGRRPTEPAHGKALAPRVYITFDNVCWPAYETLSWYKMRKFTMFINSVCVLLLIKLRWSLFRISLLHSWVLCRIFKSSLKLANRSTSTGGLFWFTLDDQKFGEIAEFAKITKIHFRSKRPQFVIDY